jgi:Type IV pilin-like G and H, putative
MMPHSNRIFLTGMLIISLLGPSYPTDAQAAEVLTSQTNLNLIEQKLLGRWEVRSSLGNQIREQTSIVIFAPNGQYLELTPHKEAIRFQYSIDVSKQPPQIIIQYGIGVFTGTLTGSQMQFQLTKTPISEYSKLRGQIIFQARKLSADVNLPIDVTVIEATEHYQRQVNLTRQAQARSYLSTVNYAQNSYFIEYQRFAPDFQTIAKYIGGDYRGEFYTYEIFLSDNGYVVNTVAMPKYSDLKSYLGMVTVVKLGSSAPYVVQGLCESEKPTSQVSLMPKIVGTKIQCPAGYRLK